MATRQEKAAEQLRRLFAEGVDENYRRGMLFLWLRRTYVPGTQSGINLSGPAKAIRDAFNAIPREEGKGLAVRLAPVMVVLVEQYWSKRDPDGFYALSLFVAAMMIGFISPETRAPLTRALATLAADDRFNALPLKPGAKAFWRSIKE